MAGQSVSSGPGDCGSGDCGSGDGRVTDCRATDGRSGVAGRLPRVRPTLAWWVAAAGVLAVLSVIWAVVDKGRTPASPFGWLPFVLGPALAGSACGRTARLPALDAAARPAWRRAGLSLWLISAATTMDTIDLITRSGVPRQFPAPPSMALYTISAVLPLWTLLRVPSTPNLAQNRLTIRLDLAIVMLTVGMYGTYFILSNPSDVVLRSGAPWLLMGIVALSLSVAAAFIKLVLVGNGPLDPVALALLGLSVFVGAGGAAVTTLLFGRSYFGVSEVAIAVSSFIIVLAADRQRRAAASRTDRRPRHRSVSTLPYIAVVASVLLMLTLLDEVGLVSRVLLAYAFLVSGLVVVRQIVSFQENARLVRRLNSSMSELSRQEERFRSLVQYSSDIILITDIEGTFQYISPSLERILGVRAEEWVGRNVIRFTHPDDLPALKAVTDRLFEHPDEPMTLQMRLAHADGTWRWLEILVVNRLDDPTVVGVVCNARDITEARRYQDRLTHQARHDALTGLANRVLFAERASASMADCRGPGPNLALALVDLDDFKAINDRLGHAVGDALLVALAGRLRACVDGDDMVARLGGDEFAILFKGRSARETDEMIEQIVLALGTPLSAAGHDLLVQASIGLVEATADMDASELLRRADVAMYTVKEQGKSGCLRYTEDMDTKTIEHARIGAELQQAMIRGELHLVFQPVVTLPDRRIAAVEALVRWNHPRRGPVSPAEFIPIAERNGQIVALGDWVLRESCRQLAEWRRQGMTTPVRMSVNASARQLREPNFAQVVAEVLAETGLEPPDLMMEITETAVFDGGLALETVQAVHALGVGIALDDFGTGHSSLGLLQTCPVDVLKVDKLFVDEVAGTTEGAAIATSIAQIARAMGLAAVAEGVETEAQALRLHELGYRLAQGFLFARPLAADDLTGLLISGGALNPSGPAGAPEAGGPDGSVRPAAPSLLDGLRPLA